MSDLEKFLRRRLAEDEAAAFEAASGPVVSDLVAWLRAQMDADERSAMIAAGPIGYNWQADGGSVFAEHPTDEIVDYAGQAAEHIAVHDPARVLHQVAAMRKIVDLHRSWADEPYRHPHAERYCQTCSDDDISWWTDSGSPEWPCPTLRLLTTVYADRDGYRPEWAPE